jgi:transposase InsO family protein
VPEFIIGVRVSFASPGDLAEERKLFDQILSDYNIRRGFRKGVAFIPVRYEQISSGQGDPQQLINARLAPQ